MWKEAEAVKDNYFCHVLFVSMCRHACFFQDLLARPCLRRVMWGQGHNNVWKSLVALTLKIDVDGQAQVLGRKEVKETS